MLFRRACLFVLFASVSLVSRAQIVETKNQFVAGDVEAATGVITIKYVVGGKAMGYLTNPGHSYLSLSINGVWFTNNNVGGHNLVGNLGSAGTSVTTVPLDGGNTKVIADTIQTTFNEGGGTFDIIQEVYPVAFRGSGQVVWRVKIVNHSNTPLNIGGIQYLNDLQAGTNDNPYLVERNYFDGQHWRVASKDGTSPNPPSLYIEIDQDTLTSRLNLIGVGYTNDSFPPAPLGLTPCLGFAAGSWQQSSQNQLLDYLYGCPPPPSPNATSDMACVLQWAPHNVPAANAGHDTTIEEFRTSFGTFGSTCISGFLDLDFVPESVTYNATLKTFARNPFNVLSLRINLSDSSASNVFDTELCLTNNVGGTGVQPSYGIGRSVPRFGLADFLWQNSVISLDTNIWIQFHDYAQGLNVRDLACGKFITIIREGSMPSTHILSRSGSYDGSTCNARTTILRAFDTGSGRSTIFVRPDSTKNVTVSIPKLIADTITYSVSVIDSMYDGFAFFSIRDTFGNVMYDTVRYCTIPDKHAPLYQLKEVSPNRWDITVTDTVPWDRGIDWIRCGSPDFRVRVDSSVCSGPCCNRAVAQILKNNDGSTLNCSVAIKDCAGNITYTTTFVFNDTSKASVADDPTERIRIYPNPSTDIISIEVLDATQRIATIQNLLGRTVLQQTIRGADQLDISKLAPGTYILRVGGVTRKIIKE